MQRVVLQMAVYFILSSTVYICLQKVARLPL